MLPRGLMALGLISLRDELRHEVQKTLAAFAEIGVQIKVLSGDHPQTVATLARQVGMTNTDKVVAGSELEQIDGACLTRLVEETTIWREVVERARRP